MSITDMDFNRARSYLVNAGSAAAAKFRNRAGNHVGNPVEDGEKMIREAIGEFSLMEEPAKTNGMRAVKLAAGMMGVDAEGGKKDSSSRQWQ